MVAKLCWYCRHFLADNPGTLVSGICTRHAPKGSDYQSRYLSQQTSFRLDMGHLLAAGTIQSAAALPLHALGNADTLAASCHAADTTGLNSNDIMPFQLPVFDSLNVVSAGVAASLLNSGTSSVGDAPYLHLYQISVLGASQTVRNLIDIPIASANVQVNGTATDLFSDNISVLSSPVALAHGCCGFRVDLTQTGENDISEVRNLKIGLLVMGTQVSSAVSAASSKAKYAAIIDGTAASCGEFSPAAE